MSRFLISLVYSIAATAHAQGLEVYDGVWSGEWRCGTYTGQGKSRFPDGFSNNRTFTVTDGVGTSRWENATDTSAFTLRIQGKRVLIDGHGAMKANTDSAWTVHLDGTLSNGRIRTEGSMADREGRTIRPSCSLALNSPNVESRIEAAASKAARAAANAAKAEEARVAAAAAKAREREAAAAAAARQVTAPPKPVPATPEAPARTAAIATLPPKAAAAQGYARATPNPADAARKTGVNEVWLNFNPSITVQERQSCRIVENHRANLTAAEQSNNQIKVNEALRSFVQAINALLPDGKVQGWVMRAVQIAQASEGSAAVLFELPCGVYVGSNTCDANPKNFYGSVPEGSRVYSELAKMSVNDFTLVSGQFVFPDDKVFDRTRSVAAYGYLKTAAHCKAQSMPLKSEFFGLNVQSVSVIK